MSCADRLIAWALKEGSTTGLALFRIVVGLMVIRHLVDFGRDHVQQGFYADTFYLPYTPLIPQPPEAIYVLVLALGITSAAMLIVGFKTRAAAITCCLVVAYHLSLNQIWYRHNRYFLALSLLLLCLAPCTSVLSIDALRSRNSPVGPLWASFLVKAQMTLIYLASATSKSLDQAWRSGDVLTGRRLGELWEEMVPDIVLQIVPGELGVRLLTVQALGSEFLLALCLWFRRTRRLAFWWGIIFHGFIEVQYSVLTFTYLTLGTYFLFADLRHGEKVWLYPERRWAHGLMARAIPWFDWLFQVRLATHTGSGVRFIARNGTMYRGWLAWIMLGANLPIPFVVFYPLSWLRIFPWGRSREAVMGTSVESPRISARWLVAWSTAYIAFVATINLYRPLRVPADLLRFWDLPWYFLVMCLVAASYHRVMVWRGQSVDTKSAPNQQVTAGLTVPSLP